MYGGDLSQDTKEWCKIWRKIDLWFGKYRVVGSFFIGEGGGGERSKNIGPNG